jgi:sugar/nucleoside kinase (ribokinase family)
MCIGQLKRREFIRRRVLAVRRSGAAERAPSAGVPRPRAMIRSRCFTQASRWRSPRAARRSAHCAAAALKCTRFGGIIGTPARAEVEALLSEQGCRSLDGR